MKYFVIYNDGAINRRHQTDAVTSFDVEDDFEALLRTVLFQCGEDFDDPEDIVDYIMEEVDEDFDGSIEWCKNYLDNVDVSGDRLIKFLINTDKVIYSYT